MNFIEIADEVDRQFIERLSLDIEQFNRQQSLNRYPHKCPRCGGAAYIGLNVIDCMGECS